MPLTPDKIDTDPEVEFQKMLKFMDSLGWQGRNPWYPEKYPFFTMRLYSDGWKFSKWDKMIAEGENLKDLKAYLSRYNLEALRSKKPSKTLDAQSRRLNAKQAYLSSPNGELNITIVRAERPEVTLSLDLGIPNFTVFSLKFPCVEDSPQGMQEMVSEGIRALLDEVSAFMISLKYDQDVIVKLYAAALQCFKDMTNESDTMSQFSDVSRDPTIKTFEGTFKMPIDFINQTQEKVVTGGSGKRIQRVPVVRHLELTQTRPNKADLGDVARVIRQYRNRSIKTQPKPMFVIVYDQMGRPSGTLPLGQNFRNTLLKQIRSSKAPEFTEAVTVADDTELKLKNAPGIPKNVIIGANMYFPEGFAGDDMALYLCQTEGERGKTWLVKFSDGRLIRFVERPSLQALRTKNYPVPQRYYRWSLIRDESTPMSNEAMEVTNEYNPGGDPN